MVFIAILAAPYCTIAPQTPHQAQLLDARKVARMLAPSVEDRENAFLGNVYQFVSVSQSLPPTTAAQKWLQLLDEGARVPRMPSQNGGGGPIGTLKTVFGALPRPEAWSEIVQLVHRRPSSPENKILLLLFARMQGDERTAAQLYKELSMVQMSEYASGLLKDAQYDPRPEKGHLGTSCFIHES